MTPLFANNPYFVEYETLLKQLNRLDAMGQFESDQADAVRDKMDYSWYKMSKAELDRMRGLSADLYMLLEDEVSQPLDRPREQWARDVEAALCNQDWETVLTLLRMPNDLPHDRVAYERARAYAALGHIDTALQFLNYAIAQKPENPEYQSLKVALSQPAFAEYERWLGWLHQLIAEGKSESRQANVLRNAINEASVSIPPIEIRQNAARLETLTPAA